MRAGWTALVVAEGGRGQALWPALLMDSLGNRGSSLGVSTGPPPGTAGGRGSVNKRGPIVPIFKQGQDERHGGRTQQDQNQLVLELFENELP